MRNRLWHVIQTSTDHAHQKHRIRAPVLKKRRYEASPTPLPLCRFPSLEPCFSTSFTPHHETRAHVKPQSDLYQSDHCHKPILFVVSGSKGAVLADFYPQQAITSLPIKDTATLRLPTPTALRICKTSTTSPPLRLLPPPYYYEHRSIVNGHR